jgi:hypothetical protein
MFLLYLSPPARYYQKKCPYRSLLARQRNTNTHTPECDTACSILQSSPLRYQQYFRRQEWQSWGPRDRDPKTMTDPIIYLLSCNNHFSSHPCVYRSYLAASLQWHILDKCWPCLLYLVWHCCATLSKKDAYFAKLTHTHTHIFHKGTIHHDATSTYSDWDYIRVRIIKQVPQLSFIQTVYFSFFQCFINISNYTLHNRHSVHIQHLIVWVLRSDMEVYMTSTANSKKIKKLWKKLDLKKEAHLNQGLVCCDVM